jgi:integrase/recombinase XerD
MGADGRGPPRKVFYATAIRASELSRLRIFDLDSARGAVAINAGKWGRSRVVPIASRAMGWCEAYLTQVRPGLATPPDEGWLFLNNRGGPISQKTLTATARRYLDQAGVTRPGACHLFRHTAATLMLEGGADIRFIQALLGHADLSTTQIYTHVSVSALRAVYERTHPAAAGPLPSSPEPERDGEGGDWEARAAVLLAALEADEADA